ncbi:MAG: hypothetical protein HOY79_01570 [Streptomyces sp.]|nr:hypothetical protein [Streptomyces sp.]
MANLSLTATAFPKTGASAPLNLTSLLTAGSLGANTGVTWSNTGREILCVQLGASASTCQILIGTTIEGQAVASLTPTLVTSAINVIGPFPSDEQGPGGVMTVTFGTPANVTGVALLQFIGVN